MSQMNPDTCECVSFDRYIYPYQLAKATLATIPKPVSIVGPFQTDFLEQHALLALSLLLILVNIRKPIVVFRTAVSKAEDGMWCVFNGLRAPPPSPTLYHRM
jgi:hypothetical protein